MSSQMPSRYRSQRRHSQQPIRRSSGSGQRRASAGAEDALLVDAPRTRRRSSARREPEENRGGDRIPQRAHRASTHRVPSTDPSRARVRDADYEARPKKLEGQPAVTVRQIQSTTYADSPHQTRIHNRTPYADAPAIGRDNDLGRKKSLVRPERRRQDPDEPGYYYQKHAQKMKVMPSTTGRDPLLEEGMKPGAGMGSNGRVAGEKQDGNGTMPKWASNQPDQLSRSGTARSSRLKPIPEPGDPLTIWGAYCHVITFWCPNILLSCFGKKNREQQRAWREKIGLLSIILLAMAFVGFLTFGFTAVVCPAGSSNRFRINQVDSGYMIFHGEAYNFLKSTHPAAIGIPNGTNVLYSPVNGAGKDGSFLFQNVNGACKGLITPASGSDIVTDSQGNMGWYFPCTLYNQDGSTQPNASYSPPYVGYACHATTDPLARNQFYSLRSSGTVYFTWDDVRNKSRNLMVYSGDVLDLDLLGFLNKTEVNYPDQFDRIRNDSAVHGQDVTWAMSSGENKQIAACFQDIIKVGSIEAETIGCIASKVVLYVSLAFILSIVVIKFVLAVLFQWFLCKKYAPAKTSMTDDPKKRAQQIEDWTDDIYRAPPKITDPGSVSGSDGTSKRASILPSTSRFTSPYAMDKSLSRARPTTMASQHSTARLMPGGIGNSVYGVSNRSETTLTYMDGTKRSTSETRASMLDPYGTPSKQRHSSVMDTEITGPQELIHEAVVPQPPVEWQPFGFPLAHTICLITAYSEGPEGIRTTLDSIAMTDYPNSHKLIYVICDGLVKGKGEELSTPDVCIGMVKDHTIPPEDVQPFSYVAVASGSKRHNMAKVYCGFYDYGADSIIPVERQQRVPMMVIVKCGTPAEAGTPKPGNRGKRDSQIILMSFLQKVMFDERMTELEYQMYNGIWSITGISPDFYEITLMVDADTKVFPDSLSHMVSAMVKDPEIMGLCGETKIANKTQSWVTKIQVFEYFISHHQAKAFESVFGGVTCLPGCFCMYRIKAPKGGQNYWVPILANPDIVEHYSENVVTTLHTKNLLLLGEDRYLTSLMLKTFPKRKQVFIPQAVCKTTVPDEFKVLLSQRRRWINSTVHNLMELILVQDLCGTFCFSMQFVLFIDLVGTLVLPAAIAFTLYVIAISIKAAITHTEAPVLSLILLALILGLPGVLIVITAHSLTYVWWLFIYLGSLPIWNFVLPIYAFWHFDDFSWGDTRQAAGEAKGADKAGHGGEGEFDSSKISMKRWIEFEQDRRLRGPASTGSRPGSRHQSSLSGGNMFASTPGAAHGAGRERRQSAHLI